MNKIATLVATAALATIGSQQALAHSVSIGYENAGPGAVTIWLGTYQHGGHHNEGSMNLLGVNGNPFPSTTLAFNLLTGTGVGFKPGGLVDGVTNFYSPDATIGGSAPLVATEAGFNAACPACGPVNHWQGVTFSGLGAGDYQFTWIPAASPTAEWSPLNTNMNGIFNLTGVINPTPEPSSVLLMGLGLLGVAAASRKKKAA